MASERLFTAPPRRAGRDLAEPVALPCGQLALALVGALCGPAALRSSRPVTQDGRKRVALRFEHPQVGRFELAVPVDDERSQRAVRELRTDPGGYVRVLAVLTRALELDDQPGRFRFEAVHQLTHGARSPNTDRSKLNGPVDDLLHLLAAANVTWSPPAAAGRRKTAPRLTGEPVLSVTVVSRQARTIALAPAARRCLSHYTLQVTPAAFCLARPRQRVRGPAAPVAARLRLAALIAARWRGGRRDEAPQRIALADVLVRFAWIALDAGAPRDGDGAAEAAGRALRPRLRETLRVLAGELADPARYGAGLFEPAQPRSRNALRSMLWLGLATDAALAEAATRETGEQGVQPTLEDARLRDASARPVFPPAAPGSPLDELAVTEANSLRPDQDGAADSLPTDQQRAAKSLRRDQDAHSGDIAARADESDTTGARVATVGIVELDDGRVRLQLGGGVELLLPAGVAQAAGLVRYSLRPDQNGAPAASAGSLRPDQQVPSSRPGSGSESLRGDHGHAVGSGSTAGIAPPESSSDDSDRARGARLPAALAPRTAPDPPPTAAARDRSPPAGPPDTVADQRRSA